jgi:hypothetical protein
MSSPRPAPQLALAYLVELEPDLAEVALIGSSGALLAGSEGPAAEAARELLRAGAERAASGALLAVRTGQHAIAAAAPASDLLELDLRAALSVLVD